jgi:YegS/Rv2252/BmrU family lipid kinase
MPPDARILIVANPTSGRGRGSDMATRVTTLLRERGAQVDLRYTSHQGEGELIAHEALAGAASRPGCIVACGGDGTIQEVVNAIIADPSAAATPDGHSPDRPAACLGLAPAGRCNDFARALSIRKDPQLIADTLLTGRRCAIDLGRVNGRCFCTVVTAGIDAEVSRYVDTMRMPLKGTIAYIYGAMCVLARYKAPMVRIEGEFGAVEGPIFLASSANTSSYGGAIPIAPGASPVDGLLALCIIRAMPRWKALLLVPQVLLGRHTRLPGVQLVATQGVKIESPERLQLWADGELVAETPATIEVLPRAIDVMLPPGAAWQ